MKFQLNTLVAAAVMALAAGGAQAAINGSTAVPGNSSALFVAMASNSAGTPTSSLTVDLGVSMADFLKVTPGISATAGALSADNTLATWNFGTNSRTLNGVGVAGSFGWSSIVPSFFSDTSSTYTWGVIAADNVSGNTLGSKNLLSTGAPTQTQINQVTGNIPVSNGAANFNAFAVAQAALGTHAASAEGASTASAGNAFLNSVMKGTFGGGITWSYLAALDTSSGVYLVNQQQNSKVYQLGSTYGDDVLLTSGAATFNYDSSANVLTFTAAPVPEPETYAMLLAGLAMIGSLVRRRNRGA
jgi:hypothetical protein